jgi:hypothetical protein
LTARQAAALLGIRDDQIGNPTAPLIGLRKEEVEILVRAGLLHPLVSDNSD